MTQIFVIPKPGLKIPNPETMKPLKPEGEAVKRTTYWLRRIAAKDVTEDTKAAKQAAKSSATKEE